MNAALEAIINKGRADRSPLEQCIADSVALEDMRDGDYTQQELAANMLQEVTLQTKLLHDHVLVVMQANTIIDQADHILEKCLERLVAQGQGEGILATDIRDLLKQIIAYYGPLRPEDPNHE